MTFSKFVFEIRYKIDSTLLSIFKSSSFLTCKSTISLSSIIIELLIISNRFIISFMNTLKNIILNYYTKISKDFFIIQENSVEYIIF